MDTDADKADEVAPDPKEQEGDPRAVCPQDGVTAEVESSSGPTERGRAPRLARLGERGSVLGSAGAKAVVAHTGAATGHARALRAANARMVAEAIERTHTRQAAQAAVSRASRSEFLQETAAKVQAGVERAAKEGTRAGGFEQLKGHFIERLDLLTYNARNRLTGRVLVSRPSSTNPAYDASRFNPGGFAGAIQQKSSASGIGRAIAQIERLKPGSARRATVRVPRDQVARAHALASRRIRVEGMQFTRDQAEGRLERGVSDLARRGAKATSTARAVTRGAGVGAAVSVALGVAGDARALSRGDISRRDFAENRSVDAAEGAVNAVVGTGALAAGGMTATALLGTSAGTVAATNAGAAGTAALGALSGMGGVGAATATALSGVTVATAAPAVVGTAAAFVGGAVVSKGFKRVRNVIRTRQEQRRAEPPDEPPIADPIPVGGDLPPGGDERVEPGPAWVETADQLSRSQAAELLGGRPPLDSLAGVSSVATAKSWSRRSRRRLRHR